MSTLYAVRGADLKIIVRAATTDAAGDAFWRETTRRGKPSVHSWIVESADLTPEQVAECEHVVEVEEAQELAQRWDNVQSVDTIVRSARSNTGLAMQLGLTGSLDALRTNPLDDIERDRLFAWVEVHRLHILGMGLGITASRAMALCTAAGCGPGTLP